MFVHRGPDLCTEGAMGLGPPALVEPLLLAVSCDICVPSVTSLLGLV